MKELEKVFKALGQETRLKIIFLLKEQELCVCELEAILELSQSAVSQHLRVLKEADLVTEQRVGQWVFYSLNRDALEQKLAYYLQALEPTSRTPPSFSEEFKRLKRLQQQPLVEHHLRQACINQCNN